MTMPRRQHKAVMVEGSPNRRQRCSVCGATRDTYGGQPHTNWVLATERQPWCPGAPKERP